jgi:FkbM family methyltransferase
MRHVSLTDYTSMMLHPEGEALSDHIYQTKDYWERDILDYIKENHRANGTIIDVGANIGNHSMYFANHLDYDEIIAYEPVWSNFALLQQNLGAFGEEVYAIRKAISDSKGIAWLKPNPGNMGASEIAEEGTEYVEKTSLDDEYFQNVTLIKIDVEWHEPQVLAGATNLIKRDKPLILLEDSEEQYWGRMVNLGYQLEVVWPEHKTYLWRVNA